MEEEKEESLILWCLKHKAKEFKDYCYIEEDGSLNGPYAKEFQYAIDLEGTIKTQGKHAAGVVICSDNIAEHAPMIYNKNGDQIIGFNMNECEKVGLTKFDILGLSTLSKIQAINTKIFYYKFYLSY